MSNENPTVINNRYQTIRRIGRGGMAEVYLAHDLLLDRDVALKVLFPEHAIDPNFVERFRREAQAVAGLNHPNIVSVYDWGQTGNTYFMAMEFVAGRTLAEHLRQHTKLEPRNAAGAARAIADALAYAHRNNVVHRDIKPANILVSNDGNVKVVDFGIARALDAAHDEGLTQDGAVMGTATYFSPEQAKGEGLDARSDIYSVGVLLYELITGQPPFTGETALATAYKQVNDTPKRMGSIVPGLSIEIEAVVAKCMSKVMNLRYSNAEQLSDDLKRFIDGKPTLAGDDFRARRGQAPLTGLNLDDVTTTMPPVNTDPNATVAMAPTPATEVMPATMAPVETLPEYEDDSPSKRSYIIGAVAAGVVILGGILFLILNMGGSSGVTVPNVKGKTCDVAKAELEAAKFVVALNPVDTVCDATAVVQNQSPAATDTAKSGETVTLVFPVAGIQVPAVKGLTEEAARAAIEGAGFVFVKGPDVIDKTYAIGQVAVQTPEGGTQQPKGSTITVNLSGGTGQLAIPTVVVGQTTATAQAFLQADPYKFVVTIAEEPSATIAKGLVIRTDPVVGQLVDKGAAVTLYVSSGPQPVAMPNVKGLTEADARARLTSLGLDATVEYFDVAAGNANIGKVISQGTTTGTMVTPGTKIVLTIGRDAAPAPPAG
jgi:serine/threonine-protein kinase